MSLNEKDLKRIIIEKNMMLDALMEKEIPDEGKIHTVRTELDFLLYKYYKMMVSSH